MSQKIKKKEAKNIWERCLISDNKRISDIVLRDTIIDGQTISGIEVVNCKFVNCIFRGQSDNCKFTDCKFTKCKFQNMIFDKSTFTCCDLSNRNNTFNLTFTNSDISTSHVSFDAYYDGQVKCIHTHVSQLMKSSPCFECKLVNDVEE